MAWWPGTISDMPIGPRLDAAVGSAEIAESALLPRIGRVVRQANGSNGSAIRAVKPSTA